MRGICSKHIAIVDVETTGMDPRHHEIVEIGMVLVDQQTLKIFDRLSLKVRPEHPERITPEAAKINGYNAVEWAEAGAVSLKEAVFRYARLLRGTDAIFASHNPTFDYAFMAEAFRKAGIDDPITEYHRIDVWTMAWMRLRETKSEKLSLNNIATLLGIEPEPYPHRAINGALIAYEVLRRLLAEKVEADG